MSMTRRAFFGVAARATAVIVAARPLLPRREPPNAGIFRALAAMDSKAGREAMNALNDYTLIRIREESYAASVFPPLKATVIRPRQRKVA